MFEFKLFHNLFVITFFFKLGGPDWVFDLSLVGLEVTPRLLMKLIYIQYIEHKVRINTSSGNK